MEATAGAETLRRDRVLSSRFYLDVPISKTPVIYSPAYDIAFNGIEKKHPFDSSKWGRVCSSLVDAGFLQNDRIVETLEASDFRRMTCLWCTQESYLNSLKGIFNGLSQLAICMYTSAYIICGGKRECKKKPSQLFFKH